MYACLSFGSWLRSDGNKFGIAVPKSLALQNRNLVIQEIYLKTKSNQSKHIRESDQESI